MKSGVLLFPFHDPAENPTVQLEGDLALAEYCDQLGYDEFWFGEHHCGGWQIIASPESMIAAAGQRTRHIRLGTGVCTLSYHHPFLLLHRIIQLDHLTRGRLIFGVGSGALTLDATMIGHDPMQARRMMGEPLDAITAMLRYAGPLRTAAGIADTEARQAGRAFDRHRWSVLSLVHVAETQERARAEVRHRLPGYVKDIRQTAHRAELASGGTTRRMMAAAQARAGVEYSREVTERRTAG